MVLYRIVKEQIDLTLTGITPAARGKASGLHKVNALLPWVLEAVWLAFTRTLGGFQLCGPAKIAVFRFRFEAISYFTVTGITPAEP